MNINEQRKKLNLTLKDVADYVGVSEATVSRWGSRNIANMRRDRISALAEILKVSTIDIMGITESDESPQLTSKGVLIPILGYERAAKPPNPLFVNAFKNL